MRRPVEMLQHGERRIDINAAGEGGILLRTATWDGGEMKDGIDPFKQRAQLAGCGQIKRHRLKSAAVRDRRCGPVGKPHGAKPAQLHQQVHDLTPNESGRSGYQQRHARSSLNTPSIRMNTIRQDAPDRLIQP